jgi:hypothetical protein
MMKLFFCNYHKLERDIHIDQQFRATPKLDRSSAQLVPALRALLALAPLPLFPLHLMKLITFSFPKTNKLLASIANIRTCTLI